MLYFNFFITILIMNKTSISISQDTRNLLAEIGTKDSTFDEIIKKLIEKWNERN